MNIAMLGQNGEFGNLIFQRGKCCSFQVNSEMLVQIYDLKAICDNPSFTILTQNNPRPTTPGARLWNAFNNVHSIVRSTLALMACWALANVSLKIPTLCERAYLLILHATVYSACAVYSDVYNIGLNHDCTVIAHCTGPPTEVSPLCWKMEKVGKTFRIELVVVHCNS